MRADIKNQRFTKIDNGVKYSMIFFKDNKIQVRRVAPYDDQDYHVGIYNRYLNTYKIKHKGKIVTIYKNFKPLGGFEHLADILYGFDVEKGLSSRMVHN